VGIKVGNKYVGMYNSRWKVGMYNDRWKVKGM